MQLPEFPASIKTQLAMLDSTIADARKKLDAAQADRETILDTFYDLKGKLIRVVTQHRRAGARTTHFRVEHTTYKRDGRLDSVGGRTVKADGSQGYQIQHIYSYQLYTDDSAQWRVVNDVDAA